MTARYARHGRSVRTLSSTRPTPKLSSARLTSASIAPRDAPALQAVDPLARAVSEDLLLPNGHGLFQGVDESVHRRQGFRTVSRGHRDDDRDVADREGADTVLGRHREHIIGRESLTELA